MGGADLAAGPLRDDLVTMRVLSWLLLAAGLTAGSLADRIAERAPLRAAGRVLLRADLHVHAFPGDGVLPAWELRSEAAHRGLDVIAVTNHNQSLAASFPVGSNADALPLVIPGQEVTSPDFHLAAVGVRRVVDWRLPLQQVVDDVHSQGGIAIAAHPLRNSWRVRSGDVLSALDGAEAVTGARDQARRDQLAEFYRTARERNPVLAAIGSSDFHAVAPLGRCFTYVAVDEPTERGVLEAIRRGRTAASDGGRALVGDPAIVSAVRTAESSGRGPGAPDAWRRLAIVLVLTGLVGVVCFR